METLILESAGHIRHSTVPIWVLMCICALAVMLISYVKTVLGEVGSGSPSVTASHQRLFKTQQYAEKAPMRQNTRL